LVFTHQNSLKNLEGVDNVWGAYATGPNIITAAVKSAIRCMWN